MLLSKVVAKSSVLVTSSFIVESSISSVFSTLFAVELISFDSRFLCRKILLRSVSDFRLILLCFPGYGEGPTEYRTLLLLDFLGE